MNDITALAQREKFEAWLEEAEALPWGYLKKRRTSDDAYHEPNTTDMWGAWQAASDEMVEALEARDKARDKQITELENSRKSWTELVNDIEQQRKSWADTAVEMGKLADDKDKRIAELEKAATEPVAWTDEQELRDVERSGCGYLFTVNPITPNADPRRVIKLYTVQPAMESRTVTAAASDVLAERQRQISMEGRKPEHDDEHVEGQLSDAAACYALFATDQRRPVPAHWPWSDDWWKQRGQRRDLVRAGALIIAEIERLDRAAGIQVIEGEG